MLEFVGVWAPRLPADANLYGHPFMGAAPAGCDGKPRKRHQSAGTGGFLSSRRLASAGGPSACADAGCRGKSRHGPAWRPASAFHAGTALRQGAQTRRSQLAPAMAYTLVL